MQRSIFDVRSRSDVSGDWSWTDVEETVDTHGHHGPKSEIIERNLTCFFGFP